MINPKVPLGIIVLVLMGVLAGQMTYKWKKDIILTTVVTVVLTFVGIWMSTLPSVSGFFTGLYGGRARGRSPRSCSWATPRRKSSAPY